MNAPGKEEAEKKKLTTRNLTNMAFAYKQSATMIAAIELGLFDRIVTR